MDPNPNHSAPSLIAGTDLDTDTAVAVLALRRNVQEDRLDALTRFNDQAGLNLVLLERVAALESAFAQAASTIVTMGAVLLQRTSAPDVAGDRGAASQAVAE